MIQRRSFLKTATIGLAVGMLPKPNLFAAKIKTIGVQLYTLRDRMATDPAGTLAAVAKLGYKEVEGYTTGKGLFFGLKPSEFKTVLDKNGLKMPSTHIGLEDGNFKPGESVPNLTQENEKLFKMAKEVGVEYLVCPWLDNKFRGEDGYKRAAELLNQSGKKAKEFGLNVAYHNHDFEFNAVGSTTGYKLLLENTAKEYVKFELDLFWAVKSGQNPVEIFKASPGRFFAWHVKDMASDKSMTEVGSGTIDFKDIFKHSKEAGALHYYVEQDKCPADPLISVEKSIKYLKNDFNF